MDNYKNKLVSRMQLYIYVKITNFKFFLLNLTALLKYEIFLIVDFFYNYYLLVNKNFFFPLFFFKILIKIIFFYLSFLHLKFYPIKLSPKCRAFQEKHGKKKEEVRLTQGMF
jgi:hypothetical protein